MALIKCTECNKMFSDKASCCPECGCPTEIVLKALNPQKTEEDTKQASKRATDAMLQEVASAKSKADSAERLFDSRNRSIQMKASRNIDLFGGDATSRVVEIRSDARAACDDLYTSYQTLVETLDGVCRPFLAMSPSGEAIKAVRDLIQFLNDESEIESNFTASFNGSSLGNVANSKYVPSISNKMIQKFWEAQYSASPYAIEYEMKKRKEAEEAKKKREAEEKKRAEEKQAEQQRRDAEKAQAKIHMEKIVAEAKNMISEFEKQLNAEGDQRLLTLQAQINEKIQSLSVKIADYTKRLESLSVFQFVEKKKFAQDIQYFTAQSTRLSDPNIVDEEQVKIRKIISVAVDQYSREINEYLAKRFPYSKYGKQAADRRGKMNEYSEDSSSAVRQIPDIPNVQSVFDNNTR